MVFSDTDNRTLIKYLLGSLVVVTAGTVLGLYLYHNKFMNNYFIPAYCNDYYNNYNGNGFNGHRYGYNGDINSNGYWDYVDGDLLYEYSHPEIKRYYNTNNIVDSPNFVD